MRVRDCILYPMKQSRRDWLSQSRLLCRYDFRCAFFS